MAFYSESSPSSNGLRLYVPDGDGYLAFHCALRDLLDNDSHTRESLDIIATAIPAEADLEVVLEGGRYVFTVKDARLTQRGFDRLFHTINPTPEAITSFLWGAHHYYQELRYGSYPNPANMDGIVVEFYRLEKSGATHPPRMVATGPDLLIDGMVDLVVEGDTPYGMKLTNNTGHDLFPSLLYFDNSDLSIGTYYQSVLDTFHCPLPKEGGTLTIGYGAGPDGSHPFSYFLRGEQDLDIGFMKLVLSTGPKDLASMNQASPFEENYSPSVSRSVAAPAAVWGSILVPVIQRRYPTRKIEGKVFAYASMYDILKIRLENIRKAFQAEVAILQRDVLNLHQTSEAEQQGLDGERGILQTEIHAQKDEVARLAASLEDETRMRVTLETQVTSFKEERQALKLEAQSQTTQITELTTWLEGEREERAALEMDKHRVEEECTTLRLEVDGLKAQVLDLSDSAKVEKEDTVRLEEQIRQVEEERTALRGTTQEQNEQIASLMKRLEDQNEKGTDLEGQLAQIEEQRRVTDKERTALQVETRSQKQQILGLMKELEDQKAMRANAETQLSRALALDATSESVQEAPGSMNPRQRAKVRKGTLTDTTRRLLGFRA